MVSVYREWVNLVMVSVYGEWVNLVMVSAWLLVLWTSWLPQSCCFTFFWQMYLLCDCFSVLPLISFCGVISPVFVFPLGLGLLTADRFLSEEISGSIRSEEGTEQRKCRFPIGPDGHEEQEEDLGESSLFEGWSVWASAFGGLARRR